MLWVDMKYVVGNGVCRQDSGNLELETRKRGKSRRVWELTPSHPCNAKLGQGCSELSVALGRSLPYERGS